MSSENVQINIEEALQKTVDDIWNEWDKDGSDTLDRTEMRGFVE